LKQFVGYLPNHCLELAFFRHYSDIRLSTIIDSNVSKQIKRSIFTNLPKYSIENDLNPESKLFTITEQTTGENGDNLLSIIIKDKSNGHTINVKS